MSKHHSVDYTIPLMRDRSSRLLGIVIGFMVYIATLTSVAAIMLVNISGAWSHSLAGRVTVILPAPDATFLSDSDASSEARAEAARQRGQSLNELVTMLERTEGVASVNVVTNSELSELVRPWFGEESDAAINNLPVPQLISLRLERTTTVTQEQLLAIATVTHPDARVNAHQLWRARIVSLTGALGWLSGSVLVIIAGVSAVLVSYATRTTLGTQERIISVLDVLGAPDAYVVDRFRVWAQRACIYGTVYGLGLAALTALIIMWRTGNPEVDILTEAVPHWTQLVLLFLPALATALIAQFTASYTVRQLLLSRDES
ncbi:MAG: hypothetical protein K0U36_03675 [Alphaproteobacteria bacterium]|nr:hypothetical protein [Alphaproteobacteria bacterium]